MKLYPSVFYAYSSQLRPVTGFFEPNDFDQASDRIPASSHKVLLLLLLLLLIIMIIGIPGLRQPAGTFSFASGWHGATSRSAASTQGLYIYIYIYIEREREYIYIYIYIYTHIYRERCMCVYIYIYIYIYIINIVAIVYFVVVILF